MLSAVLSWPLAEITNTSETQESKSPGRDFSTLNIRVTSSYQLSYRPLTRYFTYGRTDERAALLLTGGVRVGPPVSGSTTAGGPDLAEGRRFFNFRSIPLYFAPLSVVSCIPVSSCYPIVYIHGWHTPHTHTHTHIGFMANTKDFQW